MKDKDGKELTPEFRLPTQQERYKAEPWEYAGGYQRFHEEQDRIRRRERMRNRSGLSIYERARRRLD